MVLEEDEDKQVKAMEEGERGGTSFAKSFHSSQLWKIYGTDT